MHNSKWFFIINPISGNGKGTKYWHNIQTILHRKEILYDFAMTSYPKHAIYLASYAILKGFRQIVAVGGDGTINEVINGIFNQNQVPTNQITFALIPIGTGNDWAKTHNIPQNHYAAINLLLKGKRLKHDIGRVDYHSKNHNKKHRFFINVAGLSYDAFVTKASQTRPKYGNSRFYYLYLIARCLSSFTPTPATIFFNNQEIEYPFFNITIGQCCYNGGGTNLVPHANPQDGLFALTLLKDVKNWEVFLKAPKFYTGSVIHHKEAIIAQTQHIRIEAPQETPAYVEVDGEWLGQSPIEFHMLPAALNVIVP